MADALDDVDEIFKRFFDREVAPGITYGVVVDGVLAHAGGLGTLRDGFDMPPDVDTVFRIASMTKSFTAAAILLLRDADHLRLDDRVATWVPELAGLELPTTDSPPITIEHLLTMSAGFPTDDPWGDRQQGLAFDRFDALLRGGVSLAWAPGTRFEYSNLGFGILGRVVTRVAGSEYRDVVTARLLEPLGMLATTYDRDAVPEGRLALGYVRRDDQWLPEPIDPYGALASMGGAFTSVRDLARWVAGFLDAFPPRDDPDGHPLARATRREMQQVHRSYDPDVTKESADAAPTLVSGGYGYGLFVSDALRIGRVVGHGGGYPGYGTYMRWHPATGIGVIGFANARYVPMIHPVSEALTMLVERQSDRPRAVAVWPQTLSARAVVERLLERWDDELAVASFAMNVELDEPWPRRRAAFERLRDVHGSLQPDASMGVEASSPAHLAWWMVGERGRLRIEILLSPERPPRIQSVTLTSVLEPPPILRAAAEGIVRVLGQPTQSWPSGVPLSARADRPAIERALRVAEALFGPVTLGALTAGDGETEATWRLTGRRGEVDMRLQLDAPGETITTVAFVPRPVTGPIRAV